MSKAVYSSSSPYYNMSGQASSLAHDNISALNNTTNATLLHQATVSPSTYDPTMVFILVVIAIAIAVIIFNGFNREERY